MSAITLYAKRKSADFEAKLAESLALLQKAKLDWPSGSITQASSLGAEDMVVTQLLQVAGLLNPAQACHIFVLETGKLHSETLDLAKTAEQHFGVPYHLYHPDAAAAAEFEAFHGAEAMYQSLALRQNCCDIRKMRPLAQALAGKSAWITGLRQEQSTARAQVPLEEKDDRGLTKLNPIAKWTWGDVWHYIEKQSIPYNPLHDAFMPSIGCAPCTRAIAVGEDFRSGRWWWEQTDVKECGLHVSGDAHANS